MFVNFSNHVSSIWSEDQITKALVFGPIKDYAFPDVDPSWKREDIQKKADQIGDEIAALHPEFVMCQGEFCLAYAVTERLKSKGIRVGGACSRRETIEEINEEGKTEKKSIFRFVQFREY